MMLKTSLRAVGCNGCGKNIERRTRYWLEPAREGGKQRYHYACLPASYASASSVDVLAAERRHPALEVRCPFCGAWKGDPCLSESGRETQRPHADRIESLQVASAAARAS